jgi:hypothetical protein
MNYSDRFDLDMTMDDQYRRRKMLAILLDGQNSVQPSICCVESVDHQVTDRATR